MKSKGYLFALLSSIMYASIGIFVKNGISSDFNPVDILILQQLITVCILLIFFAFKNFSYAKISKTQFKKLFILGALANTGMLTCNYESYKYLSVPVATVILFTSPALIAIASHFIFKNKISRHKVLAILGTFLGCLLVINVFSPKVLAVLNLKGISFAFMSAILFAFINIYAEMILDSISPVTISFYNAFLTLGVLLIFNYGFLFKLPYIHMDLFLNTLTLSVICGIIPSLLFYFALKYIGPIPVSIIGTLEIPFSAILAFLFLNEIISLVQLAGIVVSVISVILLKLEPSKS